MGRRSSRHRKVPRTMGQIRRTRGRRRRDRRRGSISRSNACSSKRVSRPMTTMKMTSMQCWCLENLTEWAVILALIVWAKHSPSLESKWAKNRMWGALSSRICLSKISTNFNICSSQKAPSKQISTRLGWLARYARQTVSSVHICGWCSRAHRWLVICWSFRARWPRSSSRQRYSLWWLITACFARQLFAFHVLFNTVVKAILDTNPPSSSKWFLSLVSRAFPKRGLLSLSN